MSEVPIDEAPVRGWVSPAVSAELPGLELWQTQVVIHAGKGRASELRERLRELSNRWAGAQAIALRRRPIPSAYRVCFRQIGLDPDVVRTPIEAAIFERMFHGGFRSRGLLADALLLALLDTGVPVWALDPAKTQGTLGIRVSEAGESLGLQSDTPRSPLAAGQLVLADRARALASLFEELPQELRAPGQGQPALLCSVQVGGVPSLHVEEALWACRAALEGEAGT